jgi:hypothetical protein
MIKPTSFNGTIPQTSKTSSQASKDQAYKPISFKGTIPQTSKTKDKTHKLQRIKPTSPQASKVPAHNTQA